MRPRKSKGDLDRRDVIVAYLRDFGRALKLEREGKAIIVYTDESYIHQNHCPLNSWLSKDPDGNIIDRTTSKGRRLIILHAITKDGPLITNDSEGIPIETLSWKPPDSSANAKETDTPHPIDDDGEALTAELLWVAQSHTGDYHDNMNSDMYMRWVKNRLLPTFKKKYGDKQMILIQDNAPYHHKREIGSLASLGKAKLWAHVQQYCPEVTEITLPVGDRRAAEKTVTLTDELIKAKAIASKPDVPNADELRDGILRALREAKSPKLECKVEQMLREHGHRWIWTPPYCPWLQPVRTHLLPIYRM